jgi:ketosteroid isomerase-like protein
MSEESTTPDLVERQKRLTEAANRRDLDAMMAFYAPDAVYDMSPLGMGVFEGQAAARGFIEDWWGSYEEYEFEAKETLDLAMELAFACSFRRAVLSAAAVRFSCATQPSACGRTARSCA